MKIDSIVMYKQNVPSDFLASTESAFFYKLVLTVYKVALSFALIVLALFALYVVNFSIKQSSAARSAQPITVCAPNYAGKNQADTCLPEHLQRPVLPKTISLSTLIQFFNEQARYFLTQAKRALATAALDLQKSFTMLGPASTKGVPASEWTPESLYAKPLFSWYSELSNLLSPSKLVQKSTVAAVGNSMLHPETKMDPASLAEHLQEQKQLSVLHKNKMPSSAVKQSEPARQAIPVQTVSVAIGYAMQDKEVAPLQPVRLNNEQPKQNAIKSSAIENKTLYQPNQQNNRSAAPELAPTFDEAAQPSVQPLEINTNSQLILPQSATLGEPPSLQFDEKFKDFFQLDQAVSTPIG
ncbi:MAG: hypothetical protein ACRC7P_02980 [Enterovibrio sp.]